MANAKGKKKKGKAEGGNCAQSGRQIARSPIPRWRLWLYRFVALIIIPTVILVLFNVSLRVVGYGYSSNAMTRVNWQGRDAYCGNFRFGWRFWPSSIARQFEPFTFLAEKPLKSYRIFVLGASAARGTPEPAYGFCRFLELMLEHQYPQTDFELINTGIPAINSHVVLPIAQECASKDADLMVIYLGNNEVIGPYGAGTVFSPLSDNMSYIRFDKALQASRLGQLLKNSASVLKNSHSNFPRGWGGLAMFVDNLIRYDDEGLEIVYRHFEKNLEDIIRVSIDHGSKVLVCSVASNIKDSAPFASLHRNDITSLEENQWDALYDQGVAHENGLEFSQAIESYLSAAEIDDTYADLRFRTARLYWRQGHFEKAKAEYIAAREYDAMRFRADNRINEIIRETAVAFEDKGVCYLDTVGVFEEHSPHSTPGQEFFHEHVHMNFTGNYILAGAMLEQIEAFLPESIKAQKSPQPGLTEQQCSASLAYSNFDKYLLHDRLLDGYIIKPPFTSRLYNQKQIDSLSQKISTLKESCTDTAMEMINKSYVDAIEQRPSDWQLRWKYARFLVSLKKTEAAAKEIKTVIQLSPNDYCAYTVLASVLATSGKSTEALDIIDKALEINPDYGSAYVGKANILLQLKRNQEAVSCLEKAIALEPYNEGAILQLVSVLEGAGQLSRAIDRLTNILADNPDQTDFRCRLAKLYKTQGELEKSIQQYRLAIKSDASLVTANYDIAVIYVEQKKYDQAVLFFQEVLELQPNNVDVLNVLSRILSSRKDSEYFAPERAVSLATKACQLHGYNDPVLLDTLAISYAASGDYKQAIEYGEKAVKLAQAKGETRLVEQFQRHLDMFYKNDSYRETHK